MNGAEARERTPRLGTHWWSETMNKHQRTDAERANRILEAIDTALEHNHQRIAPHCPWCGAREYPVDQHGDKLPAGMEEGTGEGTDNMLLDKEII